MVLLRLCFATSKRCLRRRRTVSTGSCSTGTGTQVGARAHTLSLSSFILYIFDVDGYFIHVFFPHAEKGPNGGPFLVDPLEKGFLGMSDDHGMKFALMWANQVLLHFF